MKRFSTLGLAVVSCLATLGGCGDSGVAPGETRDPIDSTSSLPSAPRVRLLAFGVSDLGIGQRGDTTAYRPSVRVVDDRDQPVTNAVVDFAIVSGGGTIESSRAMSASFGIASAGMWRLGAAAGRNVLRVTSPSSSDTAYLEVEGADVDTSRSHGRYALTRLDGAALPSTITGGYAAGFVLQSATFDIDESRFVFTYRVRPIDGGNVITRQFGGNVRASGPYLMLLMDGTDPRDYYAESPAIVLTDGRLRIDNFAWNWQFFGRYWDFTRER